MILQGILHTESETQHNHERTGSIRDHEFSCHLELSAAFSHHGTGFVHLLL
jgi:hypothetical protein